MGKFQQRATITPYATILGWRRLQPNSTDKYEFSGQVVAHATPELHEYISYLKFDTLEFYPTLRNHWDEHFLGRADGKYYTLFLKHHAPVKK